MNVIEQEFRCDYEQTPNPAAAFSFALQESDTSNDPRRPAELTAPAASIGGDVMRNDAWKRYADSRLKQFSTR